jgi:hypothetical protein
LCTRVLLGVPSGRDHWEDLDIGGRLIKLGFREIRVDGANWIQLAQARVHWQVFVNTVMNLGVA